MEPTRAITVLLIEDNPGDARLVKEALAETGVPHYDLVWVPDLAKGITHLAGSRVDAILLDLTLPDSRGYDTFDRLHARAPQIPTILLTGLDDEDLASKAIRQGAQDYLVKGKVGHELLARTIRYAIERKRAEDSLRALLRRHEALLAAVPEIVMEVDNQKVYTWANQVGYEFFGADVIGKEAAFYFEGEQDTYQTVKPLFNGNDQTIYVESWQRRKDGQTRLLAWWCQTLKDQTGMVTGALSSARDITESRQAEVEIRKLNAELEGRVEARTRELRQAQEQLIRQEKLAVLGQLAGGVGHELRNPLGVINNAVYFLKLVQPEADEKVKEYLGMIEKETHTAEKIITDLLDFARIKSVDREPVSVSELVQRVLARYPAPESVVVLLDFPASLPNIYVDLRQMEQVLGNLTVNAFQAMPQGGVLTLSAKKKRKEIAIAVADTGMGIPPENMRKLFEPLFTTKPKGIGLGLAVSQKLVEANGGRIEVQSELGKGSVFTVYTPVSKEVR